MKLIGTLSIMAVILPTAGQSQVVGKRSASTCLDLRDGRVAVTGTLKLRGPLEVRSEKRDEKAFYIELPNFDCVEVTPATPVGESEMIADVRVNSNDHGVLKKLAGMVGQNVTATGTARLGQIEPDGSPLVLIASGAEPSSN